MNIRKIVTVLTVIMLASLVIGVSLLFLTGGVKINDKNNLIDGKLINIDSKNTYDVDELQTIDMDNISNIRVTGIREDITIIPEDRKDVSVRLHGKISNDLTPNLSLSKNGSSLDIEVTYDKNSTIFQYYVKLDISIPKDYKDTIRIDTTSGDLDITKELSLEGLSVDLTSGDVDLKDIKVNNFSLNSTSGDIEANNLITDKTIISLVSGDMSLDKFTGNLNGESTSGDIKVTYEKFNNNINLESTSGDLTVDLPNEAQFILDAETVSGDINSDFPILVKGKNEKDSLKGEVGTSNNKIILKTTSGDISIN